jgi:hypothetical protein
MTAYVDGAVDQVEIVPQQPLQLAGHLGGSRARSEMQRRGSRAGAAQRCRRGRDAWHDRGRARHFVLNGAGNTTYAPVTTLVRELRVAVWAVGAGSAAEVALGRLRE